jgi:hypothetical protein
VETEPEGTHPAGVEEGTASAPCGEARGADRVWEAGTGAVLSGERAGAGLGGPESGPLDPVQILAAVAGAAVSSHGAPEHTGPWKGPHTQAQEP